MSPCSHALTPKWGLLQDLQRLQRQRPQHLLETSCPARCLGVSRATLTLRPQPHHSLGSWGVFWGQRMGRVWEQPWLESEVRLGPRRAYPKVRLGAISPPVSQPQCGQKGAHTSVPRSVQTPSCGGKGPAREPPILQFSTCSGRNL